MARLLQKGKILTCHCKHEFRVSEANLNQPSYAIEVFCPKCNSTNFEYSVWNTTDNLFERSTEDIFQDAIDMFGFLPLYDWDGWPLTFSSSYHADKRGPGEGYNRIIDFI